jgi:TolA-binding protein
MAQVWLEAAKALGPYIILSDAQRAAWHEDLARAIAAGELQLAEYPEAPASAPGLQTLLECQRMLVLSKDQTEDKVRAYFEGLAAKYQGKPAAHSRILFRLAALSLDADPARALAEMQAAYNPAVVYSPLDMQLFTQELMKGPDLTAASLAFDKLAQDYPLPPGVAPGDAPQEVQDAQAIALAGQGQIALKAGRLDEARQVFSELAKDYPKSPQRFQADLGLAEVLAAAGKFDEALPLLAGVAKSPLAPQNARARALFLNGQVQEAKGQDGAIDAYLKLAAFYPGAPEAAESLWRGAQLLEKQAAGLGDLPSKPGAPTRPGQLARARKAYTELTAKYAGSPFAEQARSRLTQKAL